MTASTTAPVYRRRHSLMPGAIRLALILLAFVLYVAGTDIPAERGFVIPLLLSTFAGVLSVFAHFVDACERVRPRRPLAAFVAGGVTLVPPCVIASSLLPTGFAGKPWIVGVMFFLGAMLLLAIDDSITAGRDDGDWDSLRGTPEPADPVAFSYEDGRRARQSSAIPNSRSTQANVDHRESPPATMPHVADDHAAIEQAFATTTFPSEAGTNSTLDGFEDDYDAPAFGPDESAIDAPEFERSVTDSGEELLAGTFTRQLNAGEKVGVLHIPIVPPLDGTPQVDCEVVEGDEMRVRVTDAQPYGIRIELRRSDATTPGECIVGVLATSRLNHDAA